MHLQCTITWMEKAPNSADLLDVLQADTPRRSGDNVYEPIAVVDCHVWIAKRKDKVALCRRVENRDLE